MCLAHNSIIVEEGEIGYWGGALNVSATPIHDFIWSLQQLHNPSYVCIYWWGNWQLERISDWAGKTQWEAEQELETRPSDTMLEREPSCLLCGKRLSSATGTRGHWIVPMFTQHLLYANASWGAPGHMYSFSGPGASLGNTHAWAWERQQIPSVLHAEQACFGPQGKSWRCWGRRQEPKFLWLLGLSSWLFIYLILTEFLPFCQALDTGVNEQ